MEYTKGKCDCHTTIVEGHRLSDYMCPLHKAAPDMYEALKDLRQKFITAAEMAGLSTFTVFTVIDSLKWTDKALAKAEEEK